MTGMKAAWRAEWAKTVGTRSWLWWGIGICAVAAGISALLGELILSLEVNTIAGTVTVHDQVRGIYTSPLTVCYLMALVAGVNIYAKERRQTSLAMTVLIAPRRIHVILAKYALAAVVGTWCGFLYVVGVLLGGGSVLLAHGLDLIPDLSIVRILAVMLSLFVLWCLFGTGLGMCLPALPALFTGFALALVLPAVMSPILAGVEWGRKCIPLFPGVATNMATEPENEAFMTTWIPWWGSYIVVCVWVGIIAVLGARSVLRAEIAVD